MAASAPSPQRQLSSSFASLVASSVSPPSSPAPSTSRLRRGLPPPVTQSKKSKVLDGSLVGSRIKVWWPGDKKFYDGVVKSFDGSSMKHKIVYDDGDVEQLLLKNEKWEFTAEEQDNNPDAAFDDISRWIVSVQKGTTSVPSIEESMMAYVDLKREQASVKNQASQQGTQYSITRCLEVLNAMDDVSDEVKVYASDVFKDAANREIFLGYNSRLRALWLKKEVDKIIPQPPPSRSSCGGVPPINLLL